MAQKRARFRFYAELNDFLPQDRRFRSFTHSFEMPTTVKDMIEGLGVPHTEVDLILVGGEPVGFDHRVDDGDHISVYPVFESLDVADVTRVRPEPLRHTRFVVDANLGQLARYLRLLGFDSTFDPGLGDRELAEISGSENRVLLTRDLDMLQISVITHGYYVRGEHPRNQVIEVIKRFDLFNSVRALERCAVCNGELEEVDKKEIAARLQPGVAESHDDFRRCSGCDRIYWQGGHHRGILSLVQEVARANPRRGPE
jgi:uncharacterized protein with PIN domain